MTQTTPSTSAQGPVALLPCPFCGADAQHEPWHGGAPTKTMIGCSARCDDCDVGPSVTGETFEEAAALWNSRTAAPSPAASGASPSGVRGKPLEWVSHAWGCEADGGRYRIEDNGTNWTNVRYWLFIDVGLLTNHRSRHNTLDAAKAAADYIRASLASDATPDHSGTPGGWLQHMASEVAHPAPATVESLPYQALFDAIAAATDIASGGLAVSISVEKFRAALAPATEGRKG